MPEVKKVQDADVAGKRVLVRCDLDVLEGSRVIDDRLRTAVPTLELLRDKGAVKITVIGHAGRPDGKVVEELKIAPIAARLQELAGVELEVRENLRFDPREEANDAVFAQELASLGDIFVNESFANSHRMHASVVGIPKILPSYAGLHLQKEIEHLSLALTPPQGSIAIVGGVKFETKVPLLKKLTEHYSSILLGGALANDLLKSRGTPVGASLVSNEPVPADIAGDERIQAPVDVALVTVDTNAGRSTMTADVRANEKIVDVGPETARAWSVRAAQVPFVLWNGPLGVYEHGYTDGTDAVAEALVKSGVKAVVGGGDTIAAISKFSLDPQKVFLSTGGGAMLEFLVQGTLVGIEALRN